MPSADNKPRILIVDDEVKNIKILGAALSDDYHISVATSGADALVAAASDPRPDLILLDVVMPTMHGYAVCEQLKHQLDTTDIPVIFVTSLNDDEDETRGLEAGAVDYITKPYRMPIIKARISVHVRLRQQELFIRSLASEEERPFDETRTEAQELLRLIGNE